MSVLAIQRLLASVFFVLGGWRLISPGSVLALCFMGWRKAPSTQISHAFR